MKLPALLARTGARPLSVRAGMLEVPLQGLRIGEVCELLETPGEPSVMRAVVTAVGAFGARLAVLGPLTGLSCSLVVMPTGRGVQCLLRSSMLGGVFDANGVETGRLAAPPARPVYEEHRALHAPPLDYRRRRSVERVFHTGIRAMDGLLTCGEGQRLGIFAPAGCGKTSLLEMVLEHAQCDVLVLALIGERGRELADAAQRLQASRQAERTIIVHATSDCSAALRCQAALLATTMAEYFRDQGARVLLQVDSVTRYARALRDLALAAGEPPARRGYPASVFEALPALVERPGAAERGSITAFYTVLLEDEDLADPVGEEVKSLLDGHVYLSGALAGRGHYPAIDVLRSGSRLFSAVTAPQHQVAAQKFRHNLALLKEMQVMRDVGEYAPGNNHAQDRAVAQEARMTAFLQQDKSIGYALPDMLEQLRVAAG